MARIGRSLPVKHSTIPGVAPAAPSSLGTIAGSTTVAAVGLAMALAVGTVAGSTTVSASTNLGQIAVTDLAMYFSPFSYSDGVGSMQSNNVHSDATFILFTSSGGYLKTKFGGTSFVLKVDVSALVTGGESSGNYPIISYSVDGAAATRYQLTSSDSTITLATGLSNTIHTLQVDYAAQWWSTDQWNTPVQGLKITGATIDAGSSLYTPVIYSGVMFVVGDSVTAGVESRGAGLSVSNQDASTTYARQLATLFQCEVGIAAYPSQGYNTTGTGNAPTMPNSWNLYYSGKSRLVGGLLVPQPTIILTNHGINDASFNIQSEVVSVVAAWRAAAPNSHIVVSVPWTTDEVANLTAAVATIADARTTLASTGTNSYSNAGDNHLLAAGHTSYANALYAIIKTYMAYASTCGVHMVSTVRSYRF